VTIDDTLAQLRPRRRVRGSAAVLLPFTDDGDVDWAGLRTQLEHIAAVGLVPAVNMDTGYVSLVDAATRASVLDHARATGTAFVAGAYVDDAPGCPFDLDAHQHAIDAVAAAGGLPVLFPSHGQSALPEPELLDAWQRIGARTDRFLAFELGAMFLAQGRILSLEGFEALLGIPSCVGAKHSSLDRTIEWERLRVRDRLRPDFALMTGNDLAIDMVMYGSDYLLGLAAFAPEHFARRDEHWANGDDRFYALNDELQYLGRFAFRPPVPAYRHDAAMFLYGRGHIASDRTHPASPHRPASDRAVLDDIARALDAYKP
jgi:dihydrodipicolinate synthase/N-acetylneuraminate lyase